MSKVSGTIEAVARNSKVIKIGDEWYSAFKVGQLNGAGKGDTVELEYETVTKGGRDFHNIKGNVTLIGGAPKAAANDSGRAGTSVAPGATTARDVSIVRQSSLNRATEILAIMYGEGSETPADVLAAEAIDLAKTFEAYVLGENA